MTASTQQRDRSNATFAGHTNGKRALMPTNAAARPLNFASKKKGGTLIETVLKALSAFAA